MVRISDELAISTTSQSLAVRMNNTQMIMKWVKEAHVWYFEYYKVPKFEDIDDHTLCWKCRVFPTKLQSSCSYIAIFLLQFA